MNMILQFTILLFLTRTIICQNPTPCPEILSYEPKQPGDRWYGVVKYSSPKNISGIWLHITLDRPADILGNWFGQVTTSDNTVYDIRKPDYKLQAGVVLTVRFFVKYNLARAIPSVVDVNLNEKTICIVQKKEVTPTTSKPHFNPAQETFSSGPKNEPDANGPHYIRPNSPQPDFSTEDVDPDSEYYPGDLNIPSVISPRITPVKSGLKSYNCGTTVPRNSSLSLQPGDTWRGQWPWHAALYRSKGANLVYICGATLITEQHVIAPAHCVTRYHTKQVNQPNSFVVSLGKYSLNRFESHIQDAVVSDIVIHPEYNHSIYINDIAVLKLSKPMEITNFVMPACLWDENSDLNIIGKEGTIIGWGTDKNRKLMQAKMTVVPTEHCISSQIISIFDKNYCVEFENGTSACRIKSISGMLVLKKGTNTMWQVRGVNIFAEIQEPCESLKYMLFTDVAKYMTWITEVISNIETI